MHNLSQLYSGELRGTKHLRLSCNLTEVPPEVFSLAESLEVLDLSGNKISSLPADFARLRKLRIVFFSDNLFTEFPSVLSECKELSMIGFKSNFIERIPENALPETTRWLILTNNKIKELPASIGKCPLLQKVALAGNELKELPSEMMNCRNLELLRISANQLKVLPEWLLDLPKLAWLAFAGNPFSRNEQQQLHLQYISWNEFDLKEQLGEGASGHISKAFWKTENKNVAIKVFKGEVTSDGYPDDEMKACVAAGDHPVLPKLIGEIKDHPQQKQGLIMELIPSHFYNLGLPPSLDTCTRDTFPEGTVFTALQILNIGTAIASGASYLHEKGIMHGDLYAHNMLIDKESTTLFGDFGAASFYNTQDRFAQKIQQLECRAFACLLDDLLAHLRLADIALELTTKLRDLKEELMQTHVTARPLFSEVHSRMASWKEKFSVQSF